MDNIICKMMDGHPVTAQERDAVVDSVKMRLTNGERGDDLSIAMEALGCNYEAAQAAVTSGDKDAALALLNKALGDDAPTTVMASTENPSELELRMHQALKDAWVYVDKPLVSRTAKNEVGRLANAESIAGRRVDMLFALQTAWTFVHGSGNQPLLTEMRALLNPDQDLKNTLAKEPPTFKKDDALSFGM